MKRDEKENLIGWMLIASGIHGLLSVALGAFAAHALKGTMDPEHLSWIETACRYEMYHALALLGVFGLQSSLGAQALRSIAWYFAVGAALFSGSLDLMAFTDLRWLGAVTPVGGAFLLFAWFKLFWLGAKATWLHPNSEPSASSTKYSKSRKP